MAVTSRALNYGVAQPISFPTNFGTDRTSRKGAFERFKFFVCEITGLLFIIASGLYIFLMPQSLGVAAGIRGVLGRTMKRTLDILGATVGLILTAPIMAIVAVLIKLDSPGPIFYTQTRIGVNRRTRDRRYCQRTGMSDRRDRDRRRDDYLGRPFEVVKFRTMVQDAEKATGPVWATKNDPRITRLGAFMRKTRIDEIPQFWSVLTGDMSLVGPRPERPKFVKDLVDKVDGYRDRLDVKPGLTGLAQVENGYDSSLASVTEKVRFDLQYIRGWSIWSDVRILLKTVVVVVTGKGAC